MLIFRGILGLLQCTILPGLLAERILRVRGGILERLIWLLPLSLLGNYLTAWLLTAAGCYTGTAVLILIAAEITALLWLSRDDLLQPLGDRMNRIADKVKEELSPLASLSGDRSAFGGSLILSLLWIVSGCLALSAILWALHLVRLRFGTVFTAWDTLFSWNLYAETWADGRIPVIEGLYPQLIPANWSISYLLLGGNEIQLFNTLIPPLFFLLIQLMFFDLAFQRRESAFFLAAVIARYTMKKLMGDGLFDGYMDVPAACMVLLTVYTCLKAETHEGRDRQVVILFSFLFACAAAVTKQSGISALVLYPVFYCFWIRQKGDRIGKKAWAAALVSLLVIVAPWYLFCVIQTPASGTGSGELIAGGILDFNHQYELSHKIFLARQSLGIYAAVLVLSLIGLPLVPRKFRLPFFLLIAPLTVVWVLFYAYDARNICAALPFMAASCGWVLQRLAELVCQLGNLLHIPSVPFAAGLLLIALAAALLLSRLFPDPKLISTQNTEQKKLFGEKLNQELLYGILGDEHDSSDILTDYPADFLSGYKECCSMINFSNSQHFEEAMSDPQIRYLLKPLTFSPGQEETSALFEQYRWEGKLKELGCSQGYYIPYCLYEIGDFK